MKPLPTLLKTLLFLVVAASGILHSCGNQNPKRVAKKFLQLYYIDNDFYAASKLVTEASLEGLQQTALLFEFDPNSRIGLFKSFKIVNMNTQVDKAICYYEVDGVRRRLLLSKIDERWFVDMPGHITINSPDFSLTLSESASGGFASAESELTRVGDVPERK